MVLEQITSIWEKKKKMRRGKEMGKEEEKIEKEEGKRTSTNTLYLVQNSPQNESQI